MKFNQTFQAILILTFTLNSAAFAGTDVGNGGDGVVCRDAQKDVKSIELLDYYEAKTQRGIFYDLGGNDLSVQEKVLLALSRLERLSPLRAQLYKEKAIAFFDEVLMLHNVVLIDVPDSEHVQLPIGCAVEQLIIQKDPIRPEDKRYIVNADLWNLLDSDNKAGLILHEIIYQEAIQLKQVNSIATRYMNSLLSSKKIDSLDLKEFIHLLKINDFKKTDIGGITVSTDRCQFDAEGFLESAIASPGMTTSINGKKIEIRPGCPVKFTRDLLISQFYPYEQQLSIPLKDQELSIYSYDSNSDLAWPCDNRSFPLGVYPGGELESAMLHASDLKKFQSGGSEVFVSGARVMVEGAPRAHFYPDGKIASGGLSAMSTVQLFDGRKTTILPITSYGGWSNKKSFRLSSSGKLLWGKLKSPIEFIVQNKKVFFDSEIEFRMNGTIWKAHLARPAKLIDQTGKMLNLPKNTSLELDELGRVVHFE